MKKQFLLLAAITVSILATAQTKPAFGVRAGLSAAGMRGDAVTNLNKLLDFADGMITTNNRLSFFAGTYAAVPLSETVSAEPALYYAQKGYALKGDLGMKSIEFLSAGAKSQLNMHYIDLPIVIKGNFNGFQIFAGPQVSYLAKANLKTTAGVLGINLLNKNGDVTAQFNRWDAGLTGGVGYQFANGVNLTAAYDYGLSKADANKSMNVYNRSFKIGVGFSF